MKKYENSDITKHYLIVNDIVFVWGSLICSFLSISVIVRKELSLSKIFGIIKSPLIAKNFIFSGCKSINLVFNQIKTENDFV